MNYFSLVTDEMCSMKAEKVKSGTEGKSDHLFIQVSWLSVSSAPWWPPDLPNRPILRSVHLLHESWHFQMY